MTDKLSQLLAMFLLGLLLTTPVVAGGVSLKPGTAVTVDCATGHTLTKKATLPTGSLAIVAGVTFTLDSTGTILKITLQNTSVAATGAALYALDLGLPKKLVNILRMEASFGGFPVGTRWYGPTDAADPTNGTGNATFAAREALAGRFDEYLSKEKVLTNGFLQPGQSGTITIKLTLSAEAKKLALDVNPVAYFLVPDPTAQTKRLQVASTGIVRAK